MKPVTISDYVKTYTVEYPDEWNSEKEGFALDLLIRVNSLFEELKVESVQVASGWRPEEVNRAIGGAPHSWHVVGRAIDVLDNRIHTLGRLVLSRAELLKKFGLWMENPYRCVGKRTNWVHLDTGFRVERLGPKGEKEWRVFEP